MQKGVKDYETARDGLVEAERLSEKLTTMNEVVSPEAAAVQAEINHWP